MGKAPLLRRFHKREIDLDERTIEQALAIAPRAETQQSMLDLLAAIGTHNIAFEATPSFEIRAIIRYLDLTKADVVYDLGAGYGHFVLYGAALTSARFVAIEIVPARCAAISDSAGRLGLRRLDVVNADIEAVDLEAATAIYLNNPFFDDKSDRVVNRLASLASRPLIVATNRIVALFRESRRFEELDTGVPIAAFRFGAFRPRQGRQEAVGSTDTR